MKINDIKIDASYCIEAIVLKVPERREVQTKSGESIALSEMFVEDDTGQIWVKVHFALFLVLRKRGERRRRL